jgi:hypothetical protein
MTGLSAARRLISRRIEAVTPVTRVDTPTLQANVWTTPSNYNALNKNYRCLI